MKGAFLIGALFRVQLGAGKTYSNGALNVESIINTITKQRLSHLGNAVIFQLAWFACIFGGNIVALIVLPLLCLLHYFCFSKSLAEWKIIGLVGCLGLCIDSLLIHFQYLPLEPLVFFNVAIAPWWLVSLWIAFAMTLRHSLVFLQNRMVLAVILTAIAAPWAYYAGAYLRGVSLAWPQLCVIGVIWSVWLPLVVRYIACSPSFEPETN